MNDEPPSAPGRRRAEVVDRPGFPIPPGAFAGPVRRAVLIAATFLLVAVAASWLDHSLVGLVTAIGTTLRAELPQVVEWPVLRFNTLVLGLSKALAPAELRRRLRSGPDDLAPLRDLLAQQARPLTPAGRAWTDDRAPVEWVTDRMIVSFAAHGGRLDEDFLPTRP